MNKWISMMQKASHGKTVLVLFVLTNIVYATILIYSIPSVLVYAPELVLFDMSPAGYSYDEAMVLLNTLGIEGRSRYLNVQLPIDLVYPVLFAICYAFLITWVLKKSLSTQSKWFLVAFIPLLAGLFDYLENAGIALMLNTFPDVSEGLVAISSGFTIVKSVLTTLFFIALLVSLLYLAIQNIKKR